MMKRPQWKKRILSTLLAASMMLSSVPTTAFAVDTADGGLCAHHTEHTAECHYAEAVEGQPCTHEHSEECYAILECLHTCGDECADGCAHECTVESGCITRSLDCHHTHGDCGYAEAVAPQDCTICQSVLTHAENCGYVAPVAEVTCACAPGEDGTVTHTEGCGYVAPVAEVKCACEPTVTHGGEGCTYAEGKDGSPCTHVCEVKVDSAESCYKLLCSHSSGGHDDACGYVAAVEAHDCQYKCGECFKEDMSLRTSPQTGVAIPEGDAENQEIATSVPDGDLLAMTEKVCDCGTDDESIHATICAVYVAPENPVCYCAEKCTEVNEWCDVCGFDYTACTGTDTAVGYAEATIIASGDCSADGSSVQWTLDDAGTLTISGTGATKDYEYTNSVPWQPTYNKDIQRVIIGEGVTEINRYYFCNFPNITSVTLPSTMKEIGLAAFANCENLESVTLNEGLETMSMSAFRECVSLKTIHLPASLTQLDSRTFAGCTLSFTVDEANAVYSAVDGVLFNKDKTTLLQCRLSDTEYSVPQGVTSIEVDAFYECTALTNVEIPSSVTTIGNYAFSDCTSLTSIEIPSSVTIIGDYAFRRCTGLTSVKIPDSVTSINYAFHGCTGLTSIEIPSSVTSINGAFYDCTGLTSIEIPSSVTSMVGAFSGCTGLTSVKIPNGVTTIGSLAFEYCTGLTSIEIPNSVTTIGNYAFSDCTSLTSITIPHSVTSIESNAFDGCTKLTTVTTSCVPQFGWTDEDWETNVGHSVTLITEHTYENGVCTICDEPCGHTGGEATCTTLAVCDICKTAYGELGGHSTTAEDDKAATCASKAYCSVCDSEYGEVDTTNHDSSVAFDSNGFCPNGCYQPAELKDGYYQIENAGNLYWFAQQVNGGNGAINGKLTTNIVVNQNVLVDGALNSNTEGFRVWTPIGYWNSSEDLSYYVGTFDGAGFTVSGLYLNDSTKSSIGLFGAVSTNGIVKNVGVVDSYFCGKEEVGGVVGYIYEGTVQNCYNTGIVSGNTDVGGVVGYNTEGTVQNCYNMGTVSSNATTGGVVSLNWGGLVTNCHNTGTVKGGNETGGVVGYMISGYIEHCYNTGAVNGSKQTGGILGCSQGGSVKNCYNTGTVSGSNQVGGVVGYISSGTVENCYNANSVSGSSSVGGVVGARYDSKTGTTTNCYFDSTKYSGSAIGGNDAGADTVEGKTTEQFASGEVAYLLGDAFGQNISSETYPVLGGTKVYYGYTSCGDTEKKYTNDENTSEEKPAHTGEATYTLTEDGKQHIANWSCCGTEVTEDHTGGTATCKEPAKCEHCGASYGELADHTGGTATCTTQAVCEVCGVSYGELDPNNHEYETNNGICCDTYQPAELNESGYYEIDNAGKLFWFANHVNTMDRTASAVLTADIDLEKRPWTPIGSTGESSNNFRGVFDGQNHTIEGLYVEGGRAGLGFFGEVRTGTVKNFTIYGEVVVNTEVDYVGGVIGSICGLNSTDHGLERNGAVIQNITSYVNLTAKAHGVGMIGGFVGYANHQSLIENCSWYGTFDAGIYRVDSGAGGFIGKIQENTSEVTIRNCAAYGTIKTNYVKNSYNNTATIYMGGFLSFSNTGAQTVLENCLFAGKFERGANLTDEARLGAFGTLRSVKTIKNCYYLGDDGLEAVHSDSPLKPESEITSVTGEQLKSGEIAYLLQEANNIWGQTINSQNYPVLGGEKVYQVLNCKNENAYSNTNENLGHNYVNGTCTVCGATCDHSGNENKHTDCTKDFICSVCNAVITEAAAAHTHGTPSYSWTEDPITLAVTVSCTACGETFTGSTTDMTVTTSDDGFTTTYTATVTLDGKDYTDSKTVSNEVTRVNITWGTMDFTYTDESGWNNPETAWVQVKNTGNTSVTVTYDYVTERTDIQGSFFDGTTTVTAPVTIDAETAKIIWLRLDGRPSEALSNTTIGSVKLTIE